MGQAILKENKILGIDESFLRIPFEMLGKEFIKFSITELFELSKIFSFSVIENEPTARCRSKMSEFAEEFHVSERQCSRLIKRLTETGLIERVSNENGNIMRSWYRYIGNPMNGKHFIRVDVANLQTQFEFKSDRRGHCEPYKRYLTLAEVLVLSYIITVCDNVKRNKNQFEGSYRTIARKLKLSVSSVSNAIYYLKKAELLYCQEGSKAKNGSGWTKYHVNKKLLLRTQKEEQKRTGEALKQAEEGKSSVVFVSPTIKALDERADRERYYAQLREKAQNIADRQKAYAEEDAEFKKVSVELNALEMRLGKAEYQGNRQELRRLIREREERQRYRRKRLSVLGMCEEDLLPRYRCGKCSDTGFLKNGRACDCYPKQE